MKVAFATHAARNYPLPRWGGMPDAAQQEALFDWAAREGFQGLDIGDSWMDLSALDQPGATAMRDRARAHGLEICGLNALRKALCSTAHGDANRRALEHALDVAAWLDCPILSISLSHPTPVPGAKATLGTAQSPGGSQGASEQDYDVTAAALRGLARLARERGVALSVELHHCSLADTSAGLLRILRDTNEPAIGANPDLINAYWAYAEPPESWRDALAALARRTNIWHVKNAQRVHIPELQRAVFLERTLGEGDVDYRWAVGLMRAHGFDGWISIENCGPGDPFDVTAAGLRYLQRVLQDETAVRLAPRA